MKRQELFDYMYNEHGITLLETDMIEIEIIVMKAYHAQFEPVNPEEIIKRVEEERWPNPNEAMIEFNRGLEKAIEILRCAPVEVCEWKKIPFGEGHGVATGCGWALMDWDEKKEYVGCPYCLRKIKRI